MCDFDQNVPTCLMNNSSGSNNQEKIASWLSVSFKKITFVYKSSISKERY